MFNTTEWHVWLYRYPKGNCVIINHLLVIVKFNVYESRDLNFLPLKSDIIKIRQIEENLCRNDIQTQRKCL